eukprot:TRINITY_DN25999_c0_g1_i1.p1 TRINITY_DN25999_c0_g1~~TRINITY_DN25999_c0_g1_i1.p1  ORF type:complete len:399 (+),score=43.81 TRINITY_DN25999_c0_g1_i1:151-1347(+)
MPQNVVSIEKNLPQELRQHLDFVGNVLIIALGFVLRRAGLVTEGHLSGIRTLTFTFCLPALLISIMWTTEIRQELVAILGFSFMTQALWISFVLVMVRFLPEEHRGFYALTASANSLAYVYPVLMQYERFSEQATAMVVLWELGGNLAVAVIFYGVVANAYSPQAEEEGKQFLPAAPKKISRTLTVSDLDKRPAVVGKRSRTSTLGGLTELSSAASVLPVGEDGMPCSPTQDKLAQREGNQYFRTVAGKGAAFLVPLIRSPMIWTAVVGLSLGLAGVPYTSVPGKSLNALAAAFPACLYVLVGCCLEFDIGGSGYGLVFKALLSRWLCNGLVICLVRFAYPLTEEAKAVLTLCVISPIASPYLYYAGLYGYSSGQTAMAYNVAAVTSLFAMTLVAPYV